MANFLTMANNFFRSLFGFEPEFAIINRTVDQEEVVAPSQAILVRGDRWGDEIMVTLPCRVKGSGDESSPPIDVLFLVKQGISPSSFITRKTVNKLLPNNTEQTLGAFPLAILTEKVIECRIIPAGQNILGDDFFTFNNLKLSQDSEGPIIVSL